MHSKKECTWHQKCWHYKSKIGNVGNALNVKKYWKIKMNVNYKKKQKPYNFESQTRVQESLPWHLSKKKLRTTCHLRKDANNKQWNTNND